MQFADLAQLAEHVTSNDEVEGSNPLVSIIKVIKAVNNAFPSTVNGFFVCTKFSIISYDH